QEIAIKHRGRLDEVFGERGRRQFERETTRLKDTALHILDSRLEVSVARIDVRPGVDDGNDRAAVPVLEAVAHLHQARPMAETAEVFGVEPACAAKGLACHGHLVIGWPGPRRR